jgi:hypothetical protein
LRTISVRAPPRRLIRLVQQLALLLSPDLAPALASLLLTLLLLRHTHAGTDGKSWSDTFTIQNGGTYNNQWFVVDLKKFSPGQKTLQVRNRFSSASKAWRASVSLSACFTTDCACPHSQNMYAAQAQRAGRPSAPQRPNAPRACSVNRLPSVEPLAPKH